MTTGKLYVEIEETDGVTVVSLMIDTILDEATIESLAKELFDLVNKDGRRKFIVDFRCVRIMASAFLGKLVTFHKKIRTAGGGMEFRNLPTDVP